MAVTPPSPAGDVLPLRNFNMLYQPSPSLSPTSTASPMPDIVNALTQYQNEILGGPPVSLVWKDLKVVCKGSSEALLDRISGFAEPFCMVGVLGPPKSGKSTLLRALAGRLSRYASLEGEILVNGRRQQLTYGTSAFLTAKDMFMETLTVRENMYFSALLKLPTIMPMKRKMDLVDQIIFDMGLRHCASTRVGNGCQKGINKGERRRLSLAMELLMRPRLLYLDDSTDGLSSSASLLFLTKLKLLAQEGRTVVACICEPSSDVFHLFDYLLVLGNGRTMYFGEARFVSEHFTRSGFRSPPQQNPVNYLLHASSAEYKEIKTCLQSLQDVEKVDEIGGEITADTVDDLAATYQSSDICSKMSAKIKEISSKKGAVLVNLGRHAGTTMQIAVLTYRSFLYLIRDICHCWLHLIFSVVLMILVGTIFFKLDHSINAIQERASCIFLSLEILLFLAIGGMPFYCKYLQIFVREMLNPHYRVFTFVIATSISSLPVLFLIALLSACIIYFLVGFHPGFSHFIYFFLNFYASLVVMESLMMVISVISQNSYVGMAIGSGIQILFMLVAGYFRLPIDIPSPIWTYPMSYISFHRYAIWGLYQNEFLGMKFGHLSNQITGEHVIYSVYKMTHPGKWENLLLLLLWALSYRIIFYIFLRLWEQILDLYSMYTNKDETSKM